MRADPVRTGRPTVVEVVGILVLAAAAVALRAAFLRETFGPDGTISFTDPDAYYHARIALYSFVRFPHVLFFDPYLSFPNGSAVPSPPLYDWLLAASALALGGSERSFELTLAWASPVAAALTVIPVHAIGRELGGRGTAFAGAAIFAALPVSIFYARVGNPDHHAFVALLGATFLALSLAALRPARRGRGLASLAAALCVVRALVVLSWSGSLVYVALGEGGLLVAASVAGRRDLLHAQAAGTLGAAVLIAPVVSAAGVPAGGLFATTTLSWFHVVAFVGVGSVCALLAELERRWPGRSFGIRLARAAALGALALCVLLAFEAPRRALLPSTAFLAGSDAWSDAGNLEARALFGPPIRGAALPRQPAQSYYGWFAWLLPVVFAVTLWRLRRAEGREAAACFAWWTLGLGALALSALRFGPDFAPAASVAFASTVETGRRALAPRIPGGARSATVLALALVIAALLVPPATRLYGPQARSLFEAPSIAPDAPYGPFASLAAFGRSVRAATPETAGFLDDGRPAYGVLAEPSLGHVLRFASRRALPADNLGALLDALTYGRVNRFYATRSEQEAVLITTRLHTPYVVTATHTALRSGPAQIQRVLHEYDGSARGLAPHLGHFRLVAEGPPGGMPLLPVAAPPGLAPYKLFEVVEGAVLEVAATPGGAVRAEIGLVSPAGRRFEFHALALADADGVARLRLPYASGPGAATRAEGPWRVRVADREREVDVSEGDVVEGRVLELGRGASPPPVAGAGTFIKMSKRTPSRAVFPGAS